MQLFSLYLFERLVVMRVPNPQNTLTMNLSQKLWSTLFAVALILTILPASAQNNVRGFVKDKDNNKPIFMAELTIIESGLKAFTDSTGEFHLKLDPGSYTLEITHKDYLTSKEKFTVETGKLYIKEFIVAKVMKSVAPDPEFTELNTETNSGSTSSSASGTENVADAANVQLADVQDEIEPLREQLAEKKDNEIVVSHHAEMAREVERIEYKRAEIQELREEIVVMESQAKASYHKVQVAELASMRKPVAHNDIYVVDTDNDGTADREDYNEIKENPYKPVKLEPLSTFSIDVDNASYSNSRRFLNDGSMPPKDAVRIEEFINYFDYNYQAPGGNDAHPFSVNTELSFCPWNAEHQLLQIGLQGEKIAMNDIPPSNLVFLLDVSGSMNNANKLPLVKKSMALLIDQLRPQDRVSIVVYAGSSGLVLPSTPGNKRSELLEAINRLHAGGSTAGGAGIQLAYKEATENFIRGGNNRVILCTDGDFNVGISDQDELVNLIELKRESGVFLTVLGYGKGNLQDSKMEQLADKGNGNYSYIDNLMEAKKVLISELGATFFTIAKDVKIQVEFNSDLIAGYRLIGYENRALLNRDFNDDTKDAGELGAGHTVTALYEIIPAGKGEELLAAFDSIALPDDERETTVFDQGDIVKVNLRYKEPDKDVSELISEAIPNQPKKLEETSADFRFAASVAEFGLLLRDSPNKGTASFEQVENLAGAALDGDPNGYRTEFLQLVKLASEYASDGH